MGGTLWILYFNILSILAFSICIVNMLIYFDLVRAGVLNLGAVTPWRAAEVFVFLLLKILWSKVKGGEERHPYPQGSQA